MSPATPPPPVLLEIRDVSKTFPGTRALADVSLDVAAGEVHALVGQNGSGKSTLVKVLAGYHEPDDGSAVRIAGAKLRLGDTHASREAGFRFVYQDLGLVDDLDIVDNLALGRTYRTGRAWRIRWAQERRAAEEHVAALGFSPDVRTKVGDLGAAQRTGVAIAKALYDEDAARVLVIDEPTATLPSTETHTLFSAIRRARARGIGIIYISHHLDEVFEVADRVTVLRDGRRVGTWSTSEIDGDGLVEAMVGGVNLAPARREHRVADLEPALVVRDLCGTVVDGVDLTAHRGEVLGIAGLTGSGREEILPLLFGAQERAGAVELAGHGPVGPTPRAASEAGLALVPANRAGQGLIFPFNTRENCTITSLDGLVGPIGWLRTGSERTEIEGWIERLGIRADGPDAPVVNLSGGNQQKVVLAKWLRRAPQVLLLDEPTQGVDVGAKAVIHQLVREAASAGAAVVVASSDDPELADVCDRVLVMRDGRVVAELTGADLTVEAFARAQLADDRAAEPA